MVDIEIYDEEQKSLFLSFLTIMISEIGDKTFLIAAIMAMRHSRLLIFSAAFSSLLIMSVLSAYLGHAVPQLIPKEYTYYLATLLFLVFGLKMAWEGYHMTGNEAQEEMKEVEEELEEHDQIELMRDVEEGVANGDDNDKERKKRKVVQKDQSLKEGFINLLQLIFSPVFVQAFVLTFLAEWGDRSQIATIALAAAHEVHWVMLGTIVGHSICTGIAVFGGRMLASKISVRTVTLVGSFLFICFSFLYLYESLADNPDAFEFHMREHHTSN
ncbi:uncharacterized protein VTP21DRAFT_676 [Calcarisporiella thermophila]|uniref:uncharacterized protein n=1 Tax=Calcarisporiella thermophila TaxID=911321 RepID=UPI003742A84B